jgi:asparagine synthase (glutamine-hydrolysing)
MAIKQINRYCGIIAKKPLNQDVKQAPWFSFSTKLSDNITLFSSEPVLDNFIFDGNISGLEDQNFNSKNIQNYDGNWSFFTLEGHEIILSRDRIGVRAMYYFETDEVFCFGNEIKSLLSTGLIDFQISSSAAFQFLFYDENEVLGNNLFLGIQELSPSHYLKYDLKSHTHFSAPYYQFNEDRVVSEDLDLCSEGIKDNLVKIIKEHTKDSGNTGSFLSGGIDSSCIAASIFINKKEDQIPFLTAMSGDSEMDEIQYAGKVAQHFKLSKWNQIVSGNIVDEMEEMHYAMELPTASLGSFLQYELCRFAGRNGINYLLDGTGADSLYAGHHYYHAVYWNSLLRSFKISKAASEGVKTENVDSWFKYWIKNLLKYYYIPQFSARSKYKIAIRNNPLLKNLNPDFINDNDEIIKRKSHTSLKDLNSFLAQSFFGGSVKNLLRFPDRFGKYFGVANISVFAENRALYETAFDIPDHMKIRNGQLKFILRKAFHEFLPLEILERNDKKGLVAPNNRWLKENKDYFLSYIDRDLDEFFDVEKMKDALSAQINDMDNQENYKVFKFLSFAIWKKVYSAKYRM